MKEFEHEGWLIDVYQNEQDGEVQIITDCFGNAFVGVFLDHEKSSGYNKEELVNKFRATLDTWRWLD